MQILPNGKCQFIDSNGTPLAGGQVFFYAPGTTNPVNTYQDSAGTTPNTNPVVLDSNGQAVIWGTGTYRQVVQNAGSVTIWDQLVSAPVSTGDLSGSNGAGLVGYYNDTIAGHLLGKVNRVVDSIAALRTIAKVQYTRVFVAGYYAAHDGGGGNYQYDPTDTSSADNGGTIIVSSDGGRWKLSEAHTVSVKQFGAKGNGTTNDTNCIVAAMTACPNVEFPAGTYVADVFTIPATVKSIVTTAGATLIPSANVPTGAGFSTWITAVNLVDAEIRGLRFQAASATYSGLTVLLTSGCTNTKVKDLVIKGAGYTGISMALGTNNKVLNCYVTDYKGNGIQVSGSSLSVLDVGTEVAFCYTLGNGTSSIAHGVAFVYCIDFDGHDNRCEAAGTFGVNASFCEGGKLHSNTSIESVHEGLNVEDSNHVKVIGNTARWAAGGGASTDFGMSFFANTRNCVGIEVVGNNVVNSGSSGLCFTGTASYGVQHSGLRDNFVFNCNAKKSSVAGGSDNLAGILIAATLTQANVIDGNTVIDLSNAMTYGIAELNRGSGMPSSNEITRNRTFSSSGFSGAAIQRANTFTTLMGNTPDLAGLQPYNPVVSSSAGAITSYTSNGGYVQVGRTVFWVAQVTVTNNGTGSGQLNVTGPFAGVASSLGAGVVSGQNVSTGKAISGAIPSGGSSAVISNYDGTYPVATGNAITVFGIEAIA